MTPSFKPGVQTLEAREVPAMLSGGVLYIHGTSGNDTAQVEAATVNGVAVVRVTENGVVSNFLRSSVYGGRVQFSGLDGDDQFVNYHATLRAAAYGGAGADRLYGGVLADTLDGGTENDYLVGGGGNDLLYGQGGNDRLYGGTGDDRLYGGSGNDKLYGQDGNDFLDGSTGVDRLEGGNGNDGMQGGPNDEGDTLVGGAGGDRFLNWTNDIFGGGENRVDVTGEDAVVFFRNAGEQWVLLGSNIGLVNYSAGTWTASQIESVDRALVKLQTETGNTKLLKTDLGGSLTFHKAGNATGNPANGWNAPSGNITLTNSGTVSDAEIQRVAIHEVGHNWDTEHAGFQSWLNLSGWEQHIPGVHDFFPPAGKVKSGDGLWWHTTSAGFARDYGKMNPLEDFATSWEAFFNLNGTRVASKMAHIQNFMDSM